MNRRLTEKVGVAAKIPQRLSWAVKTLAVQPDDRILEIGCGRGVAVSLICEKLNGGQIAAIDRSAKMIEIARSRNQRCVASGKVIFQIAALHQTDFAGERFNKIFAVNVNVFWLNPVQELHAIRKLLTPEGALYLFYEPPSASPASMILEKVTANLHRGGFSIREELSSQYGIGIIATL